VRKSKTELSGPGSKIFALAIRGARVRVRLCVAVREFRIVTQPISTHFA